MRCGTRRTRSCPGRTRQRSTCPAEGGEAIGRTSPGPLSPITQITLEPDFAVTEPFGTTWAVTLTEMRSACSLPNVSLAVLSPIEVVAAAVGISGRTER